ncbi:MAG TPA: DEAD/DEAH box helicase [Tepidisphaeraceae bacterium]|jgi:ATP-dependent RNA helicase RhlE|nr:DEAD/DEAH box helicase [Tepidisphaeraceae bacterium]
MSFANLGLAESIVRSISAEGYTVATPIQAQAIPHVLAGRDVLGCAQTGTGKTAAFALPILQNLGSAQPGKRFVRCVVLAPTRELASQIAQSFADYGRHTGLRHTVIFGGVGQGPQVNALRNGVDIVIATPGRLLDLIEQRHADLSHTQVFVLDEADRMLDMGFIHDIRRIATCLPKKKQTLLFSATMPKEIRSLADSLLHNPVNVTVAPVASTADKIEQSVYFVEKSKKPQLLQHLINEHSISRALVFTRTKHGADRVVRHLHKGGIHAEAIHGNKSQNARQRALQNFKNGKTPVLVASDIAARGIDVDQISHVFNYDISNEPETYVHRIGRTARAGASGVAISFCDPEERSWLRAIEKLIRKSIPVKSDHPKYATAQSSHDPDRDHSRDRAPQRQEHRHASRNDRPHPARNSHPHSPRSNQPHPARSEHSQPSRSNHPQPTRNDHPRSSHPTGPKPPHKSGPPRNNTPRTPHPIWGKRTGGGRGGPKPKHHHRSA